MKRPVIIYDDSYKTSKEIKNIIGDKSFSQIIYRKKTLKDRYLKTIRNNLSDFDYCELNSIDEIEDLEQSIKKYEDNHLFIHIYSNFVIKDKNEFNLILKKSKYIKRNYCIKEQKYGLLMFSSYEDYDKFLKYSGMEDTTQNIPNSMSVSRVDSEALYDISSASHFIKFHSNSFESRFFNSVKSDEFTVLKSSSNTEKIYREYKFYELLPESMKYWFVMPFNYKVEKGIAYYQMERLHMVDIAIRWIHGAVREDEFEQILSKSFRFINERSKKVVSDRVYKEVEEDLYLKKIDLRVKELKQLDFYNQIHQYIKTGTNYDSIDAIVLEYKRLYDKVHATKSTDFNLVVGHGDLCFSNMLYNQQVDMLRLIDPKGASKEEELWTNPYYDIAKLSHSICGLYDFINNGLFEIHLDKNIKLKLVIEADMQKYRKIFKKYLQLYGMDYNIIRIYETSLFLSMLPLHAENYQKVLGFILNAINIIEEVKACLKI